MVVPPGPPKQFQPNVPPVGMPHYQPYFPGCQGMYHHHNMSYPHNQMQMYIPAAPQAFQYPTPANAQQQPPQFVPNVGSTYQIQHLPQMPPNQRGNLKI